MPKAKVIPLQEKTIRLNRILEQFSMTAHEEWINGEFFRWSVVRKPANIIVAFFRWISEECVASIMPDLSAFAVNPNGPVSFASCDEIVSAIKAEFLVETEQIRQMSYQGGL